MQAQHLLKVNKCLDTDESTSITEGGGESATKAPILKRKQLANEQPGYGADAHGEGYGEDKHTEQRDPVVLGSDTVTVDLLIVGKGAKSSKSDWHEHTAGDEQR